MIPRHLLLLYILCLLPCLLVAQQQSNTATKRCPVKTLNFENGLSNNATSNIITDRQGFTWVSNITGMQRYNGYTFETIQPVVDHHTYVIDYPVYFFGLKNGSLWISFKEGILAYDPAKRRFSKAVSYVSSNNSQFNIVPLKETAEGIWCMQEKKGIVLYANGKMIKAFSFGYAADVDRILNSMQFLYSNSITCNEKQIFINSGADGKVIAIDTEKKQAKQLSFEKRVFSIACSDKQLYLVTDKHLLVANLQTGTIERTIDVKTLVTENILRGSLLYDNNRLFASINTHLYSFNVSDFSVEEITDLKKSVVLLTGYILKIYTDKFKRIWLLTNNDIKRIQDINIPFAHLIYSNEKNNFVRALYYDEHKHILIAGCFNGGIQLYDTLSNPLWNNSLITRNAKDVLAIEKLENDKYLIVTVERGWQILTLSTRTVKAFEMPGRLSEVIHPRQVNFSNNLQRINDSVILIATAENVFKCTFRGVQLHSAEPLLKSTTGAFVSGILLASNGTYWISSLKGFVKLINNKGDEKTLNIPGDFPVRTMAEDDNHNVWIGTEKGLFLYSRPGKLRLVANAESGMSNDCIYSILPAAGISDVYCGNNKGITYVSANGAVKNFSREMGLQENEFNTNAALKTSGGKFYFGGVNGITAFYPSALSVINDTPLLHITRLIVNDSTFQFVTNEGSGNTIELNYSQNRIRLDVGAMGIFNTDEYVYKYRMHGFENAWQTTFDPRGINYILQPGQYDFEVAFSPGLSTGNVLHKTFVFIINPPWWQTWWFRIVAAIILVGSIALVVQRYSRVKYKRKIQSMQIQFSIQAEKERISRELHDDLGSSVNMLSYNASLLEETETKSELLVIVERIKSSSAEMLLSLRETVWALKQESITSEDVWRRVKNFAAKCQLTYSHIHFAIEEESGTEKKVDYNKAFNLVRILQEALNNSIKHSNATCITCSKTHDGSAIEYCIADNGNGFNTSGALKADGNGLQNMQERATESSIYFSVNAKEGNGTSVTVRI